MSAMQLTASDALGLQTALAHARQSYAEGGVPIGAALVLHGGGPPRVLGQGHNQRIQSASAILHGETAALQDAGRRRADVYRQSTMVRAASSARSYCAEH